MITTTEYIQRKTITTDDAGRVTITTDHSAHTLTEFLFSELNPEAQARAIRDAIEEEDDPENWHSSQTYFSESEIWECAEDLTKQQPIRIYQDYGCSYQGEARAHRWGAAWEEVTKAEHNGICYSMDICDKWNEYAARIIALQEAHEEAEDKTYFADTQEEQDAYNDIAERIENAAEELTEEAARAVGDVVDGLIEAERDYYTSPEFWREWLADSDDRYTRDGARI